ncbi:MAG: hypothetical protein AB2385_02775 [Symbiobacterium sp.]|uniref:hypothetical protein n=1 Tax=Symbiobacterium sp. TaxID=1971213 RepID=UPI0034640B5B
MREERKDREQIEALRERLHARVQGPLDPQQVENLLPISRELDRLTVALLRRRWKRDGSRLDSTKG